MKEEDRRLARSWGVTKTEAEQYLREAQKKFDEDGSKSVFPTRKKPDAEDERYIRPVNKRSFDL